jgi:putative ABC transport system permease protein
MSGRTPLAILNLLNQPVRTSVSILGVTFALVLVFMQLGFLGAVGNTATIVLDRLEFDLIIRSPEYLHLYEADTVDQRVLQLVAGYPEVQDVSPFYIMLQRWQSLGEDQLFQGIALMGMRLDRPVFDLPEVREQLTKLTRSDALLIDRATRADFGPADGVRFGDRDIGRSTILGRQRVQIVGHFHLGTGLATNGGRRAGGRSP